MRTLPLTKHPRAATLLRGAAGRERECAFRPSLCGRGWTPRRPCRLRRPGKPRRQEGLPASSGLCTACWRIGGGGARGGAYRTPWSRLGTPCQGCETAPAFLCRARASCERPGLWDRGIPSGSQGMSESGPARSPAQAGQVASLAAGAWPPGTAGPRKGMRGMRDKAASISRAPTGRTRARRLENEMGLRGPGFPPEMRLPDA